MTKKATTSEFPAAGRSAPGKPPPSKARGTTGGASTGRTPPAPPKSGTAKKPRARKAGMLPPDLLIPQRRQGPPLKLVARPKKGDGADPFLRRMAQRPRETLRDTFTHRPDWLDDLLAIILIMVGVVSILALISLSPVSRASISDQWADFLTQIFGRFGALLFALLLIGLGALIVVPRMNVVIYLTWRRALGIEIAFVALLALLHLLPNDPEPRALARSGLGGGQVGWAVGELVSRLFGPTLSVLIFAVILAFALATAFGVRRKQIRAWAKAIGKQLEIWGKALSARAAAMRAANASPARAGRFGFSRLTLGRRGHVAPLPPGAPIPASTQAPPSPAPFGQAVPPARRGADTPIPAPAPTPVQVGPAPIAPSQGRPRLIDPLQAQGDDSTVLLPPSAPAEKPLPAGPKPASHPIRTPPADAPPPVSRPAPRPAGKPLSQPIPPSMPAFRAGPEPAPDNDLLDSEPVIPAIETPPPGLSPAPTAFAESPFSRQRPEPPPRRVRHFTVEDFKEPKFEYPRPGMPPLTLLNDTELNKPTEDEVNTNVRIIEDTLLDFDIDVEVVDVRIGPTVTQYAVQPFRETTTDEGQVVTNRVRVNKIVSLASDLGLALAAKRLRIQAYVPGHTYMGIEVPNREPSLVALRPLMETEAFARAFRRKDPDAPDEVRQMPMVVPLGRDVSGEPVIVDLATMPHLLIAGTTGSGKSVCITATITALLMNNTPDKLKLILLDPKMVELTRFSGLPHLLGPAETDHERIIGVLRWATREMDRRYKLLEAESARNIEIYNRTLGKARESEQLPYIVILVDEIGDLMLSRPDEMERTVTRLAQMARAVGMHLVVATQRPSTDIITGLIKANFPSRISFSVASNVDSRVILDSPGAETLIGKGDLLYLAPDAAVPRRVQGAFVSDPEIDRVIEYWMRWKADNAVVDEPPPWERAVTRREALSESESMLEDAIDLVVKEGEASVLLLTKRLNLSLPRAAQIMDLLNELGILGEKKEDGRTRSVILKPGTDKYRQLMKKYRK